MEFLIVLLVVLSLGSLLPVSGSQLSKNTQPRLLLPSTKMTLADTSRLLDGEELSPVHRKLLQEIQGLLEGGNLSERGRFPWMAMLVDRLDAQACGGVLIDKQWVATAAHCLDPDADVNGTPLGLNPRTITGVLRTTDGEDQQNVQVFVGNAVLHPKWNGDLDNGYDIALIKLSEPADVQPIRMAATGAEFKNGEGLVGLGFGRVPEDSTKSRRLRWGKLSYQDNDRCNQEDIWNSKITGVMMCAGAQPDDNAQLCKGDSGGPLIQPHTPGGKLEDGEPNVDLLVGLTSFGDFLGCDPERDLKESRPMVFTRISEVRDWIDATVEGTSKEEISSRTRTPEAASKEPAEEGPQLPVDSDDDDDSKSQSLAMCKDASAASDNILFWQRTEMGFLFLPDWPKSCKRVEKIDLIQCTEDINTKNGCCSGKCLEVLEKMSAKCWKDFAQEMCSEDLKNEIKLMHGLGRRCRPDLGPFSCKDCDLPSEEDANAELEEELGTLAFVTVPEACGSFISLSLLLCEKDLEVEAGCCDEPCLNLLDSMTDECWIAFNEAACKSVKTRKVVELMNDLSKRCDTVHRPVMCQSNEFFTPLTVPPRLRG